MTIPRTTSPRRRTAALAATVVLGVGGSLLSVPAASAAPAATTATAVADSTAAVGVAAKRGIKPGFKVGRLKQLTAALRAAGAIGVSAQVRQGNQVWSRNIGNSQRNPGQPVRPGARFRAASNTKQLVSVLALQMVARGRWSLRTTLGEAAPGLWPAHDDVTLRELLSHTSGIPEFLGVALADVVTGDDLVDAVSAPWNDAKIIAQAKQAPAGQRGVFSYANTNYVLVGQMLRRTTGKSMPSLIRERILRPAGMRRSFFATTKAMPRPRMSEYARFPGGVVDLKSFQPSIFSSSGALVSTAGDLNAFRAALADGRLLPKRLVRVMQRQVAPGSGYGLGSYSVPNPCAGGPAINGHDGASFGTLSMSFGAGPRRQVSIAITGRSYLSDAAFYQQLGLLQEFVTAGFGAMCKASPDAERKALRAWPRARSAAPSRLPRAMG